MQNVFVIGAVLIALYLIGLATGILIEKRNQNQKTSGYLRMVQDAPDEPPYLFLDLDVEPQKLCAEKKVVFIVVPPDKEAWNANR